MTGYSGQRERGGKRQCLGLTPVRVRFLWPIAFPMLTVDASHAENSI